MKRTATVTGVQSVEKSVEYDLKEDLAGNGKEFKTIKTDKMTISLFPSNATPKPGSKSALKYNARVILHDSGINFQMAVKEISKDGETSYLAGQKGRNVGSRAIISDWVPNESSPKGGDSYERMSVPQNLYKEIIGLIEHADGLAVADE